MTVPEHFIGLDLGTTGVRAVVFDAGARVLGEATREYPLHTPRPGWAEQDSREVTEGALACLRSAVRKSKLARGVLVAIGVSGTFHSVLPVDGEGRPLGRGLIWADTRAGAESDAIRDQFDVQSLYERTGCPMHPMYLGPKIQWLTREFGASAGYRSIKEQVLFNLTGIQACDRSVASGSGLLNMATGTWDDEMLSIAGVSARQLGDIVETTSSLGTLLPDIARAIGISPRSPVIVGAGDGVLASLGAGTIGPGQMTATIGTSGAVRLLSDSPKVDAQRRTWCYYLAPNRWVVGAAINNAGIASRWTAEKLLRTGPRQYDRLVEWASQADVGAGGLLFLPFLTGERAPFWNADARGVMFGLAIDHDHRHIARATLEGICFRMRSIFEALVDVSGGVTEIRATGGFTRSPFWLQLLADVLQQPLRIPSVQEASSLGAAEMAMIGSGALRDFDDVRQFVTASAPIEPNRDVSDQYQRLHGLYMDVYWRLTEQFHQIAAIQRGE